MKRCEDCGGEGGEYGPLGYGMQGSASLSEREGWVKCDTCKGTGEINDEKGDDDANDDNDSA